MEKPVVDIYQGHVLDVLRGFEDNQFHVCITSPPYWGLRDYETEPVVWDGDPDCEHVWEGEEVHDVREETITGKSRTTDRYYGDDETRRFDGNHQKHYSNVFCTKCGAWRGNFGLEPTPTLYIQHLVEICREIRRVLRDDGTFWLNLGDSFAGSGAGGGGNRKGNEHGQHDVMAEVGRPAVPPSLKPKDLVGIPWMAAFALRDDGWWLRKDNIWAKGCSFGEHEVKCPHCGEKHTARYSGSVMPESVRDRPTSGHEYVFLFSKSQRYYYNYYAVKEPNAEATGRWGAYTGTKTATAQAEVGGKHGATSGIASEASKEDFSKKYYTQGRNVRSVWQINSAQFPEAHYAVFPEDLVDFPIAASTSDSGCCPVCESARKRASKKKQVEHKREPAHVPGNADTKVDSTGWEPTTQALGYDEPTCDCGAEDTIPCLVLDPFGGRGTTAVVAAKHNCDCVLIDLSEKYVPMSKRWIQEQIDVPVYITLEGE